MDPRIFAVFPAAGFWVLVLIAVATGSNTIWLIAGVFALAAVFAVAVGQMRYRRRRRESVR